VPAPLTAADILRNVQVVRSALSERMLARLRSAGVMEDSPPGSAGGGGGLDEAGVPEEAPLAEAAAQARCVALGIGGSAPRVRLPAPAPGPQRLPACTVGLTHTGLWERFRMKCGTPVPGDAPPIPCELRTSRGGGHVVVPLVIPTSTLASG